MKKIKARNGNVVLMMRDANKTAGGIITSVDTHDKHLMTVESVGPGHLTENGDRIPIGLKPGDVVYVAAGATYSKYDLPDGSSRLVCNEALILCIEEDDGTPSLASFN